MKRKNSVVISSLFILFLLCSFLPVQCADDEFFDFQVTIGAISSSTPSTTIRMYPRTAIGITCEVTASGDYTGVQLTLNLDTDKWFFLSGYTQTINIGVLNDGETYEGTWVASTPLELGDYPISVTVEKNEGDDYTSNAHTVTVEYPSATTAPPSTWTLAEGGSSGTPREIIYIEDEGEVVEIPSKVVFLTDPAWFNYDICFTENFKMKLWILLLVIGGICIVVPVSLAKDFRRWFHKSLHLEHIGIRKEIKDIPMRNFRFEDKQKIPEKYKDGNLKDQY